ncbi:TPA: hypothetical protein MDZ34_004803 [Klebsiella aerogenes]|nr:hypothetical protein [Klebsiella aerogenes]HBV4842105.1 hypothetical protein [Klebsiella aerogenes]
MTSLKYFSIASPFFLLSGCSLPPGINLVGAYFPAWLFCLLGGVISASCVYLVIRHSRIQPSAAWLFYLSLALFMTFTIWLLCFRY